MKSGFSVKASVNNSYDIKRAVLRRRQILFIFGIAFIFPILFQGGLFGELKSPKVGPAAYSRALHESNKCSGVLKLMRLAQKVLPAKYAASVTARMENWEDRKTLSNLDLVMVGASREIFELDHWRTPTQDKIKIFNDILYILRMVYPEDLVYRRISRRNREIFYHMGRYLLQSDLRQFGSLIEIAGLFHFLSKKHPSSELYRAVYRRILTHEGYRVRKEMLLRAERTIERLKSIDFQAWYLHQRRWQTLADLLGSSGGEEHVEEVTIENLKTQQETVELLSSYITITNYALNNLEVINQTPHTENVPAAFCKPGKGFVDVTRQIDWFEELALAQPYPEKNSPHNEYLMTEFNRLAPKIETFIEGSILATVSKIIVEKDPKKLRALVRLGFIDFEKEMTAPDGRLHVLIDPETAILIRDELKKWKLR